jgi:hypothetical protein
MVLGINRRQFMSTLGGAAVIRPLVAQGQPSAYRLSGIFTLLRPARMRILQIRLAKV